jgi:hypothetical protein
MEAMGVVIVIGIIGAVILWRKLTGAAWNAANKTLFSRKEYQKEKELTGETLMFTSTASIEDIRLQLSQHVIVQDEIPKILGDLYIASRDANQIVYNCGSKLGDAFSSALQFAESDGKVTATFKFLSWMTVDGVSNSTAVMERLRNSIMEAFLTADPNTVISVKTS